MFNAKKLIAVLFAVCFAFAYTVPVHAESTGIDWAVSYTKTVGVVRTSSGDNVVLYYCANGYYCECKSAYISPAGTTAYTLVNCTNHSMSQSYMTGAGESCNLKPSVSGVVLDVRLSFTPYSVDSNISFRMSGEVYPVN